MKILSFFFIAFTVVVFGEINSFSEPNRNPYQEFYLRFYTAGLGSNLGSMQPVFVVKGRQFLYTREQNSYMGKRTKQTDTICSGIMRRSALDSLIQIVKDEKDTSVYETNASIMSGGIHGISVSIPGDKLEITLHNAWHATAQKIVDILNTHIPADKTKILIWFRP
ncbi:MAG: hypothetical protein ACOZCO_02830, partial [Bacteroidota bacterium]